MSQESESFLIVGKPHPFSTDAVHCHIPAGQTLLQALGENVTLAAKIEVGGWEVPRSLWAGFRPKPGVPVHITAFPQGDTGKKILRIVLLIVIAIIAWYCAPLIAGAMGLTGTALAIGTAVIGAAITMIGGMIVNALIPPPQPAMPRGLDGGDPTNRLNSITGSQNRAVPGGPIPCVLGECVFFPPHAAMPYTEILGNEQYLHMFLDLGPGELVVSDIKIGETPIDNYEEVEYEVGVTSDIFSNDIFEASVGVPVTTTGETATRTTQPGTQEISVDLVFPQGLFGVDKKGKTVTVSTGFNIEYRPTGSTGAWTQVQAQAISSPTTVRTASAQVFTVVLPFQMRSATRDPIRSAVAWKVPSGQYDVRVTRYATNWGNSEANAQVGAAQWTVLRSIKYVNPSKTGTTKLAVRIRATDQLNGIISNLSVRVAQKVSVWDSVNNVWAAPQSTVNVAYVYRWLIRDCPALAKRVPPSRIDDATIKEFAQFCEDNSFELRGIADGVTTFQDLLTQVLAAGRATLGFKDGKYSVVWDKPQSVPRQLFTPMNSWGFSLTKMFTDQPHAFRVKFVNPSTNWQEDEIIVPFDGYAYDDGSGPKDAHGDAAPTLPLATKFEILQFRFVTTPLHAWKLARYHQAQGTFRPTNYSWNSDVEHLVVTRGDLVRVAHDVVEWGDGYGRIKTLTVDGSNNLQSFKLDQEVDLQDGSSFSARIRKQDGTLIVHAVTGVAKNKCLWTQDLSNAAWATNLTTITPNATYAPDGTLTADRFTATASTGNHYVEQQLAIDAFPNNSLWSGSVFVKKDSASRVGLEILDKNGIGRMLEFRFDDEAITAVTPGAAAGAISGRAERHGDDWYRLCLENFDMGVGTSAPKVRLLTGHDHGAGDSTWNKFNCTALKGAVASPISGWTADAVTETAYSGSFSRVNTNLNVVKGQTYQVEATFKAFSTGAARYVGVVLSGGTSLTVDGTHSLIFDHNNGTVTFQDTNRSIRDVEVVSLGSGWYTLKFKLVALNSGFVGLQYRINQSSSALVVGNGDGASGFYICKPYSTNLDNQLNSATYASATTISHAAAGSEGVYAWGLQLEQGTKVTAYQLVNSAGAASDVNEFIVTGGGQNVNVGDLVVIGETSTDTQELLITGVKPEGDLKAGFTAVRYAPEVYDYDLDPPTTFISGITGSPFVEAPDPPVLDVTYSTAVTLPPSDDNGGWRPGIGVGTGDRNSGPNWSVVIPSFTRTLQPVTIGRNRGI